MKLRCIHRRAGFIFLLIIAPWVMAESSGRIDSDSALIPNGEHRDTDSAELMDDNKLSVGAGINADYEYQDFDESSADISTLSFNPYVQWDLWSLSLDISWQHIDGDVFVNNNQVNAPGVCDRLPTLTRAQMFVLSRRDNGQALIDYCAQFIADEPKATYSGVGDLSVYLNKGFFIDQGRYWYGSMLLGYTSDNGDWEEGLGSGTRDVIAEGLINADNGLAYATLNIGRQFIVGGDLEAQYNDYWYGQLDAALRINPFVELGSFYEWQEAASDYSDDVSSVALYLLLKLTESFRLRLTGTHYLDVSGYPDYTVNMHASYYF